MYVSNGAKVTGLIWRDRWAVLALAGAALITELLEPHVPEMEIFSVSFIAVFSAALSIFLVFRFNESYDRWWEARKIWGQVVNLSRDLARQTLGLLDSGNREQHARDIIYAQIAFVHALRIRLREGDSPKGREETEGVLRRLMPQHAETFARRNNVPTALLQFQSKRLGEQLRKSPENALILARLDSTWSGLIDAQGASERIKNTVFPDMVSLVTRILVFGLAFLLFMATLGPGGREGIITTVAVASVAMGYIWIETLGVDLKDPFENKPNDIAMTAISVGIERDLREMLGETDLPEPVKPVKGVLM